MKIETVIINEDPYLRKVRTIAKAEISVKELNGYDYWLHNDDVVIDVELMTNSDDEDYCDLIACHVTLSRKDLENIAKIHDKLFKKENEPSCDNEVRSQDRT